MNPRVLCIPALSFALLLPDVCWADDAYDEETDAQRPTDAPPEDEDAGKASGESLSAGGLTAPSALPQTGDTRTAVEKDLDEAEAKDAGRGLEFAWIAAEMGVSLVGLSAAQDSGLIDENASSGGSGLLLGAVGGVRLLYFSLGARFRRAAMADFKVWSLAAEAAFSVPLGHWEPKVYLGGGYTGIVGLEASGVGDVDSGAVKAIGGPVLRLGLGLDYFFSDTFSAGIHSDAELLFLSRKGSDDLCTGVDCPYAENASGTGLGAAFAGSLALHF